MGQILNEENESHKSDIGKHENSFQVVLTIQNVSHISQS